MKTEREKIINFFEKRNNIELKYGVKIDSGKPGKNILISGAIHGNEPVGVEFAYNFIKNFDKGKIKLDSGSITFVLTNYKAFVEDIRYVDTDMNRIFNFPEDKKKTFEYQRAKEISLYISKNNIDFNVDLHSVSIGDFKMYICDKSDRDLMDFLAETSVVNILFYFNEKHIPGTLMSYVKNHNGKGVVLECGNHTSGSATEIARKAVDVLLNKFGVLKNSKVAKNIISKKKLTIYNTIYKIETGRDFKWLIENPATDVFVSKGQEISTDLDNGIQKAPQDSFLVMPSKKVLASDNDAGFLAVKN